MKRIHRFIAGATGALALAAATVVIAAPNAPGDFGDGSCSGGFGPGRGHMMHGGPGGRGGMWAGGAGVMSVQALAQMKTRLAITPQQETAWKAFATKATEQAGLMQAAHEQQWKAARNDTSAPANMARHLGLMTQQLTGMQAMSTAMTDLYAVLTPEQRGLADRAFGPAGPRGNGPRGYGPGMMR